MLQPMKIMFGRYITISCFSTARPPCFASTTPSAGTLFVQDEALNQCVSSRAEGGFGRGGGNSDYESDPAILGYDFGSEQETGGDIEPDSDSEDTFRRADKAIPCSRHMISGAGNPVGDVTGDEQRNQAMLNEPWTPFSSERDFNLASWFVQSKVAKMRIDDYFGKGLGGMEHVSFRSTYTLEKQLETLDPFREYLS